MKNVKRQPTWLLQLLLLLVLLLTQSVLQQVLLEVPPLVEIVEAEVLVVEAHQVIVEALGDVNLETD
jgi:hypothetical protein